MKRSRHVVIVPVLLLICAGCTGRQHSPETARGGISLTYWPAPNPQEIQLADSLVRLWNVLRPDVRVVMQPIPVSQSTEEVLLAAIAGGTTPDVCSNIHPGALYDYTRAHGLVALDRLPGFDSIASLRAVPDLLETFRSPDGHYYQLPWKTNPILMFYNKRLLSEAGVLSVPRTYGEYLAAGKKVSRDHDGDGQIDTWMGERDIRPIWWQRLFDFYPFYVAASGGQTLFRNGAVSLDERAASDVFEFFRACYDLRLFPRTFFQGGDPFLLEKKATHFSGPWEVATIKKFAPAMEYGVAPLPVPDTGAGTAYTYGDFKCIAIFSTTRFPAEAWEFVRFLLRAEHDLMLASLCDQIPVRTDLLTNPIFAEYFNRNPVMVEFARQARRVRSMDAAPDMKEILDGLSQVYEACAVYGRFTPDEAAREVVRRTRMIVEWNR